jgi:hypothetical protein
MSARRYSRKATILIKQETTEGVDAVPTAGANAMKVRNLSISPLEGSEVPLDYIRGYYGASETLRVESYATCEFEIDFAGVATPGTAAPWADALLCCETAQTLIAAAVTGTAQAGGSTTAIKLAAGASATNDYYNGLTLNVTGGTNSGGNAVIIDYDGTTKMATLHKTFASAFDGTSTYSIPAASIYDPITDNQSTGSIYYFLDGVRHVMLGARGSVSFDLSAGAIPTMKFNFIGVDASITDQSNPTPVLTAFQSPSPLLTANVIGLLAGKEMIGGTTGIQVQKFSLDLGNELKFRQLLGASGVISSNRNAKGSISIEATTQTFKDWFATVKNLTKGPFFLRNGTVAGNTCTLFGPYGQLATPKYSDSDGIVMLDLAINAVPYLGNDELRVVVQ